MTTETTTSQLPPCPLPDCEGGEHHYHEVEIYTAEEDKYHDCATHAKNGYRCFGPHRPGLPEPISLPEITDEMVKRAVVTYVAYAGARRGEHGMRTALTEFRDELLAGIARWQPIEHDQIRAGMRIRATSVLSDRVAAYTGVVHHTNKDGDWFTEDYMLLTGWIDPTTYEVDPSTIPADPDADLIEKIGKAIHDADEPADEWGEDPSAETYRKLARAAFAAIRAEERVIGDE